MTIEENISKIAALRLCNACGACQYVCPKHAITYEETVGGYLIPVVDAELCVQCGLCASVCPGAGLSPQLLDSLSADPFTGNTIATYVGKAQNEEIFNNSQSGGLVSALLCCALEHMGMQGALTVVMEPGNPPRPRPRLVKGKKEIIQAQKSKYCPVPLLSILDQVKQNDAPLAVVGIPCQVHGLRNILEQLPQLADKIGIVIGLFCDRIMTYAAIDHLLKEAECSHCEETNIYFRDKNVRGYPGDIHVTSGKKSTALPKESRMSIKDVYTPARCRLCFDKLNIFSDISVGDPWGIDGVDRQRGESVAVIRTPKGKELFEQAVEKGYVRTRGISYSEVVDGQGIDLKRSQWSCFVKAWGELGRELPNFCETVSEHAAQPVKGDCAGLLKQALALDSFTSRETLLRAVRWKTRVSRLRKTVLLPAQLAKRYFSASFNAKHKREG